MQTFKIPYYKEHLELQLKDNRVDKVLISQTENYQPALSEEDLVKKALENPYGSLPLKTLVKNKKKIVIISSDHTRPVPSHITMPIILEEIKNSNAYAKITILIATGMHRPTTKEELIAKYGEKIVKEEEIVIHNAYVDEDMVYKGILPSGGELWLNKLVDEADLLIAEGFIEPHFFAGFSGGRKAVLPGVASQKTVLWNHNAQFIASPKARSGNLEDNPIHQDMLFAAKEAKLSFILNVVINGNKKIIEAFSGDVEEAHKAGCKFVKSLAQVERASSDIVITSNGGYPLDQNMYQTVKGLTAGEACVKQGGVIIISSSCCDGHGGEFFYNAIANSSSPQEALDLISSVDPSETSFDQWEAQILARILSKARVIVVSNHCDPQMFKRMHMDHAYSLDSALKKAINLVPANYKITVIPDGIAVIVK